MFQFTSVCMFFMGIVLSHGAPLQNIKNQTLYDAIILKCPHIASIPTYKDSQLLKTCSNWTKISAVTELNNENKLEVSCLLYYNAFTLYCNQSQEASPIVPEDKLPKMENLNQICDHLDIIPKKLSTDNIMYKIISNDKDCRNLCSDSVGYVTGFCKLSFYFGHVELPIKQSNKSHQLTVVQKIATSPKETVSTNAQPIEQETETNLAIQKSVEQFDHNIGQSTSSQKPSKIKVAPDTSDTTIGKEIQKQLPTKPKSKPLTTTEVRTVPPKSELPNNLGYIESRGDDADLNIADKEMQFKGEGETQQNFDKFESDEDMLESIPKTYVKSSKPKEIDETAEAVNYTTEMDGDSYFFTYFMLLCIIFIVGYVCYHNKQKILALILEGRRGKRQYRGRRPNSANYHKLDTNLEEAITSSCNKNTTNVIY